jgi:hypothetical protein
VKYTGKHSTLEVWNTYKNDDGFVIIQSKEKIETFESDAIAIAAKINAQTAINGKLAIEELQISSMQLKRITTYCDTNEIPLLIVEYTPVEVIAGTVDNDKEDVLISLDDADNTDNTDELGNEETNLDQSATVLAEIPELTPEQSLADLFSGGGVVVDIPDNLLEPSDEDED